MVVEVERRVHAEERAPFLMFSRRRCSSYSVSTDKSDASSSKPPRERDPRAAAPLRSAGAVEPRDQIVDRLAPASALLARPSRRTMLVEERHRLEQAGRASPALQLDARPRRSASSRFSRLCERFGHAACTPKRPGQALERVHGAEGVVEHLGIEAAGGALLVERDEIAVRSCSTISCASERNSSQRLVAPVSAALTSLARPAADDCAGAARARTAWSGRRWRRASCRGRGRPRGRRWR